MKTKTCVRYNKLFNDFQYLISKFVQLPDFSVSTTKPKTDFTCNEIFVCLQLQTDLVCPKSFQPIAMTQTKKAKVVKAFFEV